MGEPENERNRQMLRDAIAPFTDEVILKIGWFNRGFSTGDSWKKGPRLVKRLFSFGDHPMDNTGYRNVIALTANHVLVFAGTARPPLVRVKQMIAAWPLERIHIEAKGYTGYALMNTTGNTYKQRTLRVTLSLQGEPRPLVMDFPKIPITKEVVGAIAAATNKEAARV